MTGFAVGYVAMSIGFGFAEHRFTSFLAAVSFAGVALGCSAFRARHGKYFVSRMPVQRRELGALVALPVIAVSSGVATAAYAGRHHGYLAPALVAVAVAAAIGDGWFGLYLWMRR
jgi:hypothetical protein